jgi:hypothetical protein
MYSIAGPNAASGDADVAIEDGRSRLDGIVFILFVVSVPGVSGLILTSIFYVVRTPHC